MSNLDAKPAPEYFSKTLKKIVPAFFFNQNSRASATEVEEFAKEWGQLGIRAEVHSNGGSGYGEWQGWRLITPSEDYTGGSVYLVWSATRLEFDYFSVEDFQKNYIEVTPANREAVEAMIKNWNKNPS